MVKIAQGVCDDYARTHTRVRLTVGDLKVPGRCPVSLYADTSDRASSHGIAYVTEDLRRYSDRLDRSHAIVAMYLSVHGTVNGKAISADLSGSSHDSSPEDAPYPTWYSWHRDELTDSARQHLTAIFRAIFVALVADEGMASLWATHLEGIRSSVREVTQWADAMGQAITAQLSVTR